MFLACYFLSWFFIKDWWQLMFACSGLFEIKHKTGYFQGEISFIQTFVKSWGQMHRWVISYCIFVGGRQEKSIFF